jgi:hypothetical protein
MVQRASIGNSHEKYWLFVENEEQIDGKGHNNKTRNLCRILSFVLLLSLVSGPVYPSNPNGNNIGFSAGCMAMSE